MAVERQIFFRRIEHLHQMAAHADARIVADHRFDLVERIEPVRHQHDGAVRRQRHQRRQAGGLAIGIARFVEQGLRHAPHRDPAGDRPLAGAEHGDPLAGVAQQAGERERDQLAAHRLGVDVPERGVLHRRRRIAPQPDRGGGLPFGLAHEQVPAARALAPVDLAGAVAVAIGPVLPEGVALADAAAAVHALDHRGGDAVSGDHQRRQGAGELERTMKGGRLGHRLLALQCLGQTTRSARTSGRLRSRP